MSNSLLENSTTRLAIVQLIERFHEMDHAECPHRAREAQASRRANRVMLESPSRAAIPKVSPPRKRGSIGRQEQASRWMPAFAGMTTLGPGHAAPSSRFGPLRKTY